LGIGFCKQMSSSRVFCSTETKSIPNHTQINLYLCIELHVSTYLSSSAGSRLVVKFMEEEMYILPQYDLKTNFKPEDNLR